MKKSCVLILIFCLFLSAGCQKRGVQSGASLTPVVSTPVTSSDIVSADTNLSQGNPSGQDVQIDHSQVQSAPASVPAEESTVSKVNLRLEDLEKMSVEHVVVSGETLGGISAECHVGLGLLKRLNGIENENRVRVGRKLRVIGGPFSIAIHKKEKTLTVFLKDQPVKTYDVAVGRNDSTPEGDFSILTKIVEPVWTDPFSRVQIKAGDPRYPLGTRWMQFAPYGYGIHGTNDPSSIKKEASFGCIRMLKSDVEELYDWVCIGSKVKVTP